MSEFSKTFKLGGDLEINRLGFGAMRIVGDGVWGEPKDAENSKAVLRRASASASSAMRWRLTSRASSSPPKAD